jgi:hypothetical protein
METTENLILKLNELLDGERFYPKRFKKLLNEFKELENPKIVLIDFEFYNCDKLRFFNSKKMECIEIQDFESAARYRTLEKECQEYLDIIEDYGINKSMFFFEKEYLIYFYFGTAKSDIFVRAFIVPFINK